MLWQLEMEIDELTTSSRMVMLVTHNLIKITPELINIYCSISQQ